MFKSLVIACAMIFGGFVIADTAEATGGAVVQQRIIVQQNRGGLFSRLRANRAQQVIVERNIIQPVRVQRVQQVQRVRFVEVPQFQVQRVQRVQQVVVGGGCNVQRVVGGGCNVQRVIVGGGCR